MKCTYGSWTIVGVGQQNVRDSGEDAVFSCIVGEMSRCLRERAMGKRLALWGAGRDYYYCSKMKYCKHWSLI